MKDLTNITIETEKLLLIPVSVRYASDMLHELTDEITEYMAIYSPKKISEEINYIDRSLEKMKTGTDLSLIILNKKSKEYLGGVGLHNLNTKSPEIGIWVKKSFHRKGIGKEAIKGIINWATSNLDCTYFIYPVHKNNKPSRKLAEALGGILIGKQLKTMPWGKVLDEVIYHIPGV